MRRIVRTNARYVEVQAGPGTGKTHVAVARVQHLLKENLTLKIVLLSFSNSACTNLKQRLAERGIPLASVHVSTCHAFACLLAARVTKSSSRPIPEQAQSEPDFKAMLRAGIKALDQPGIIALDHLLVDEYQDCSRLQSKLIAKLARLARSTVVLGDRMQSIYGFTKVRYRPLAELLPNVKCLPLTLSHRLTAETATLANALSRSMGSIPIRTERHRKKPELVEAPDTATLARWVAQRIKRLIDGGASPAEIAVLGRNRGTARPVARELRALGINSTLLGQTSGHIEQILDLIAILRVVENSERTPTPVPECPSGGLYLGIRELKSQFRVQLGLKLEQVLEDLADRPQWPKFVAELQKLIESGTVDPVGRFTGSTSAYLRLMGGLRANKEMQMDLNAWAPLCRTYSTADALDRHAQRLIGTSAVTVTNVHQAKGMEWDHVFVMGVTEGVLPDFRASTHDTLDNERSLLYVAVTRPRKRLWVCHAPTFGRQARQTFEQLSTLIDTPRVRRTFAVPRHVGPAS